MRLARLITMLFMIATASIMLAGVASGADDDQPGVPSADVTEDVVDESPDTAAAPVPMSPSGLVAPGTYSTELKTSEEVALDDGLKMTSSTAPGTFAISGVVINGETAQPVAGAQVTLTLVPGIQGPMGGDKPITFLTGTDGAFAFINVPPKSPSNRVDFRVTASGFGDYTITNLTASADETYLFTVELETYAQTHDDSVVTQNNSPLPPSGAAATGYPARTRVPPFIRIAKYPIDEECVKTSNNPRVRRYPWKYYVVRVMTGEIYGSGWPGGWYRQQGASAVAQAIQGFGWYARIHPNNEPVIGADGNNTRDFQCMRLDRPPRPSWSGWVAGINKKRVTDPDHWEITQTFHRSGINYSCTDQTTGLSQLGAKARDEVCGNSWQQIVNYYYPNNFIEDSVVPPVPQVYHNGVPGALRFHFSSWVGSTRVAWRYRLSYSTSGQPNTWRRIRTRGYSWPQGDVWEYADYTPPVGSCRFYRARAWSPNPADTWSAPMLYNSGSCIPYLG